MLRVFTRTPPHSFDTTCLSPPPSSPSPIPVEDLTPLPGVASYPGMEPPASVTDDPKCPQCQTPSYCPRHCWGNRAYWESYREKRNHPFGTPLTPQRQREVALRIAEHLSSCLQCAIAFTTQVPVSKCEFSDELWGEILRSQAARYCEMAHNRVRLYGGREPPEHISPRLWPVDEPRSIYYPPQRVDRVLGGDRDSKPRRRRKPHPSWPPESRYSSR